MNILVLLKKIKSQVQCLPYLHISNSSTFKIVETDVLDLDYDGILKQKKDQKEQIIAFASKH